MTSKKTTKAHKKPAVKPSDFASSVMSSIKDEDVKMHSKWYFLALSAISVTSVFLSSLLAAIFINLAVRDIDYAEEVGLREFGSSGRNEFMSSFPWILILLVLVAVISTVILARKLEFAYKFRSYLFFGGALGLIVAFGVGMSLLGLNEHIENTPAFKPLQTLKERTENRVLQGEILSIEENYFELITPDERLIVVEFDDDIKVVTPDYELTVGDKVGILGERVDEGRWEAEAVGTKPGFGLPPRVKGLRDEFRRYKRPLQPVEEAPISEVN